jgi:maltooligosyltrehalose synthase
MQLPTKFIHVHLLTQMAMASAMSKVSVHAIPYLKSLGIDAIWISPWYPSPQHDHGYDVADYMNIEPDYGTLAQAEQLIKEAHDLGSS